MHRCSCTALVDNACGHVQLIKGLEASRGNGTSMISLIMPPKDQVRAVCEPTAGHSAHSHMPFVVLLDCSLCDGESVLRNPAPEAILFP